MNIKKGILYVFAVVVLLGVGRWSASWGSPPEVGHEPGHEQPMAGEEVAAIWTCPMHPQIQLPEFGDCPICGMDLVAMVAGEELPHQLSMSESAKELSRIMTVRVGRKLVQRSVRMVGKIDFDESTVRTISAWVPGRIDRMYVDYTGVRVQQGDHLVSLFSPELLSAQEELLAARARLKATAGEASEFLASSNRRAYKTAREKLILWGLTEVQVSEIEDRGTAEDHMMLTSASSGVVTEKFLAEGSYVQTGTKLYQIADLHHLWVRLDAYEQDLTWLRYGQDVTLEAEAFPGEVIRGRISFIDFEIDANTRTAKVRVNVNNADGRLKPGMFVRAIVNAHVGDGGHVLDPYLAGKWVCPMHPEVVKEELGICDVCEMDLVPAEDLGFVSDPLATNAKPIVVPKSAVLVTGRRAIVYIVVPDSERPTYEGREVVLGPRAGDEYIILSGLEEGEEIVANGAFRIDSAMQISAKPSMMSMDGDSSSLDGPGEILFRDSLAPLYSAYLGLQGALAGDDLMKAREALEELREALQAVTPAGLQGGRSKAWEAAGVVLEAATLTASEAAGIEAVRVAFGQLSESMLSIEREFGHAGQQAHREAFCPMAFDFEGASWLQLGEEILNPYFGAEMLRCGSIKATFQGAGGL